VQCKAILTDPARKSSSAATARKHLLSGIAVCGKCGGVISARWKKDSGSKPHRMMYSCRHNGCVSRLLPTTDAHVERWVIGGLTSDEAAALLDDSRDDAGREALDRAEDLRAQLAEAADDRADGKITREQLLRITGRLMPKIESAEAEAARTRLHPVIADVIGAEAALRWKDLPLERKQLVLRTLFTIRIDRQPPAGPARVFNPDYVVIGRRADEHAA
jgi:hypothetical protein